MKRLVFFLVMLPAVIIAQKQKPQYYIYDNEWNVVKQVDSAYYIVQTTAIGDSLFVNRIFKGRGHLWKQESFRDAQQNMPHGLFAWYDDEGRIDSVGEVDRGKKAGSWAYYNDTLGVYLTINYQNGKETARRDYIKKVIKTPNSEKTFDEQKREDSISSANKSANIDEKEAIFKGGREGLRKYLMKNLESPTDIVKTGPVTLQFYINKIGKIENIHIIKSLQLSADIEALRVLSDMPEWTPARQNGKNVIYQAIQTITYQAS